MRYVSVTVGGVLIGAGLSISGLVDPNAVFSFLHLQDFGLVPMYAVILSVSLMIYRVLPGFIKSPLFEDEFTTEYQNFSFEGVIVGGVCFGIGWALSGLGPSTALVALGSGNIQAIYSITGLLLGIFLSAGFYRR